MVVVVVVLMIIKVIKHLMMIIVVVTLLLLLLRLRLRSISLELLLFFLLLLPLLCYYCYCYHILSKIPSYDRSSSPLTHLARRFSGFSAQLNKRFCFRHRSVRKERSNLNSKRQPLRQHRRCLSTCILTCTQSNVQHTYAQMHTCCRQCIDHIQHASRARTSISP